MVSLDNGEPEVNIEVEYDGGNCAVTGDVRLVRNCADCGETLKELTDSLEYLASLKGFEWQKDGKAFEPDLDQLTKQLADGDGEVTIESAECSFNESGGSRYSRNMIEVTIPFTVTISFDNGVEGTYNNEIKLANSAGSYEECC